MGASDSGNGFAAFFKRYTKTWQHALATAGLTAFGTLTFVNRLFAVLAILSYVLPPIVLYLRGPSSLRSPSDDRPRSPESRTGEWTGSETDRSTEVESESESTSRSTSGSESGSTSESGPEFGSDSDSDSDADSDSDTDADADEPPEDPAAGRSPDSGGRDSTWTAATVPTEKTLFDVAVVEGDAYAVGADGIVLAASQERDRDREQERNRDRERDRGRAWEVAIADGPRAQSNALRGVDAVAGGGVWFAGDCGALGRLDPATGRHVDHSAPDGDTTNVVGVAAAGSPGDETVLLIDGSGRVRRGRYRDGEAAWDDPVTPGSGSSLAGVALLDASAGYVCDTNQRVYETADGGRSFEDAGLDAVEGTLTDVAATDPGRCAVSADDGVVHRYDGGAGTWTPERLDEDGPLWALALDGGRGLAGGDGGAVYQRRADGADWDRTLTPAAGPLRGVALDSARAVAVGAEGAVVECALPADADERKG